MASPGNWGEEFLVNSVTNGAQITPVITALTGGRFAIAYTDFSRASLDGFTDFSDSAIRVQVFSGDGTASGSVVQVKSVTSYSQNSPRIAPLADGGFVVTYSDDSTGWNSSGDDIWAQAVRAQRFTEDGDKLGDETLVNTTVLGPQDYPCVALLENGQFIVGWDDGYRDVDVDIKAQLFNADGSFAGEEFRLNAGTHGLQVGVDIVGLPGGGYVATWVDAAGIDGEGGAIMARVFAANGTANTSDLLVNTTGMGDQFQQSVTALAGGGFFVAWTDNSRGVETVGDDSSHYAIRGQVFDASGTPVGSEILVIQVTTYGQLQPDVLALSDGRFIVAYSDTSMGLETGGDDAAYGAIRARIFLADGSPDGDEFLVNVTTEGHQNEPQMTELPDGRVVFTWTDYSYGVETGGDDASNGAIRARILDLRETAVNWTGTDADEHLTGTIWDDHLSGKEGNDHLFGAGGEDYLYGQTGNDRLSGDSGDDVVKGHAGRDTLQGGTGDDTLIGGSGRDKLHGDGGDDRIKGGSGNDKIQGWNGADVLSGGDGADVFIYIDHAESRRKATKRDTITDFKPGKDVIDLSAIDADPGSPEDDAFVFLRRGDFTGESGEMRYWRGNSRSMIEMDLDGDRKAEMRIELTGKHHLQADDFIL